MSHDIIDSSESNRYIQNRYNEVSLYQPITRMRYADLESVDKPEPHMGYMEVRRLPYRNVAWRAWAQRPIL